MLDIDEIHLAILSLYDYADDNGVSPAQARLMLREAVEVAAAILDADDWPEMISTATH